MIRLALLTAVALGASCAKADLAGLTKKKNDKKDEAGDTAAVVEPQPAPAPAPVPAPAPAAAPAPLPSPAAAADPCALLIASPILGEKMKPDAEALCAKLAELRKAENVFIGAGEPKLLITETEKDPNGEFQLYASLQVPVPPEQVYAMLRLQLFDYPKFKTIFEVDVNTEYEAGKVEADSVHFLCTNDESADAFVTYEGQAKFAVLQEGQAYAMVSELTKSLETMVDYRGVILVTKTATGGSELVGSWFNLLDVSGQFATAKTHFRTRWGANIKRHHKNAANAAKALQP